MLTNAPRRLVVRPLALLLVLCGCDEGPSQRCSETEPCPAGQVCREGRCVATGGDGSVVGKADGEACAVDTECQGGLCLDLGGGARCATACDHNEGCSTGQLCLPANGGSGGPADAVDGGAGLAPGELIFACLEDGGGRTAFVGEACEIDEQCRAGLCHEGRCSQLCSSDCPVGATCEQAALSRGGLSATHGVCALEPPLRVVELGGVDTPAAGGAPLTFEVGADDPAAFVVVAEGPDSAVVSIHRLEAPDGTVFCDMSAPRQTLMRSGIYHGSAALAVPGTDDPAGAVQRGTYRVWPQTYEPRYDKLVPIDGRIDRVAVVFRRQGEGGLFDLDLHFAPATQITAEVAPNHELVLGATAELDRLLRTMAGIGLGQVRYFDLAAEHDAVTDGDHVRRLRRQSSRPDGHAIEVFVVKSLSMARGLAGGIPGAPTVHQRPASGILVELDSAPRTMGRILTHEVGHYLGLWHPTEVEASEISAHDTIGDTPQCPSGTNVKDCPDYQNLMFPHYLFAPDPLWLSQGQVSVIRPSPWLYQTRYLDVCGAGVAAVDVTGGFASGRTDGSGGSDRARGSCGGDGQPEAVHLYRLPSAAKELSVEVVASGFAPAVYLRRSDCGDEAAEVVCEAGAGDGKPVQATVESPEAGAYFIFVDGLDGQGRFDLSVTTTR